MELTSTSPGQTELIGAVVGRVLAPGDVVTVAGELGAGKTTFVRGACRALGIAAPVTSPTYTIGHRYGGSPDVSHLDLYRFDGLSAAEWGDLEPYFEDAICFVEWPEAAGGSLPSPRIAVSLRHADGDHRLITLKSCEKPLLDTISSGVDPRL